MDDENYSFLIILKQIISKINNPIILFTISFGLILLIIGLYKPGTIISLRVPLLTVFVVGMIGVILLQILDRKDNSEKKSNTLKEQAITDVIKDRNETAKVLANVTPEIKSIRVLAISSMTAILPVGIRDKFATLRNTEIKWLLLNPDSYYVKVRAQENPVRTPESLRHHILSGIGMLYKTKVDNNQLNFHLRCYDELPIFRVVIIDDTAYLSYYPRNGSSDNIPVFVVTKGKSWLYYAIDKYFESLWDRAKPYILDCNRKQKT